MHNNTNIGNNSNNNNNNNNNTHKGAYNSWHSNGNAVTAALLQQQQQHQQQMQQLLQQQQLQQHQQQQTHQLHQQQSRISNWITDTNRTHHSLMHNNSNNSNCQQQHQQQVVASYMQQQHSYGNYPTPATTPHSPHAANAQQLQHKHVQQQAQQHMRVAAAAVSPGSASNCYYAARVQQQNYQQQHSPQQPQDYQQQISPQQQQQQQQQQAATTMRPPYTAAALTAQSHLHSPSLAASQSTAVRTLQQQLAAAAVAAAAARNVTQQQQQHHQVNQHRLVTMDGIQSGVPTLTTSTLTPTTLRSIEETFIQLTTDHSNPPPCQAGFIPPPVSSIQNSASPVFTGAIQNFNDIDTDDSQASWTNSQLNEENSMATTDTSSAATDSTSFPNGLNGISNASLATSNTSSKNDFTLLHNAIATEAGKHAGNLLLTTSPNNVHTSNSATTPAPTRRNQGGRRPAKSTNMSPEEEEKRRIRRERNKLAAARCRKRRVDQTNELQTEVDRLEGIRETLQKEVESLKVTKNRLAFILEAHRPTCQKIRQDLLSVHTYDGLIAPTNGGNSNDSNSNIIGVDTTLSSVGRSGSPIDLKPIILDMVPNIKNEPLDSALDSNSSLDHDGPPSPKRMLLSDNSPMLQPPLPNVATLSASLAAASASLNTPIVTTAPVSFASFVSGTSVTNTNNNLTINNNNNVIVTSNAFAGMWSAPNRPLLGSSGGIKQRPNSLPTNPRNQAQNLALNTERPPTDINGVAIQTPSTGMFNFDSLMDGGTGLTPVSGPLVPTCSSQNKHPLELQTPTSEPSKLVSL